MPVNLSIKNAPEDLIERVRERAKRNHRSLQGEVLAILEEEVGSGPKKTPREILDEVRRLGVKTPSESVAMIREDRDRR